ncbi:iron ABC transporter permease [Marivibrio halodurans]|uniref:Iron ABC transporter permease n=1 Tax=Marivibrio halodurans TaxID=2039722 RepID=A0A8J7RXJ0_9PROT|nr:iron ABC transporter permease [Marivibrio halodurans]MBP5856240.1 iron ABC transporter permease [Marivibrio halodurans]
MRPSREARAGRREPPFGLLLLGLAMAAVLAGTLGLVSERISATAVEGFLSLLDSDPETAWAILTRVRLPRVMLGAMVGASLGLSGAALQGWLRNPLAEPGLIGASGAAALGAVLAFYFGLADWVQFALPVGGVLGALAGLGLLLAMVGRDPSVLTVILAGVAVSAFSGALTQLAINLAPSPYSTLEVITWLMGSLANRSFDHVLLALPLTLVGWGLLAGTGRALDALTVGEDAARSMGVSLTLLRWRIVLGVGLSVGSAVSVTGVVGFVGLVIPHLLRPLVGYVPSRLLPVSALGGAAIVLLADVAVRYLSPGQELKLGVVTALVGAPFFLLLLMDVRRKTQ